MKRRPSSHSRFGVEASASSAGFSLFEIVIAMSILSLLAGTLFGIVWKAADSASEIRLYDQRDEQVARFVGLMRQTIESLPNSATMEMAPPEDTTSGFYEMTINDAPTAFVFGEKNLGNGQTIIGLRPQSEASRDPAFAATGDSTPLFEVAVSREDFIPTDSDGDGMVSRVGGDSAFLQADQDGRYWLPVLNDVTAMSWRFWDEDQRDWLDQWDEDDRMPELLELSIDDRFRPAPMRIVFEVPAHLSDPASNQQQSNNNNSGAGSSGGGGGATDARPSSGSGGATGRPPGQGGGDGRPPFGGRPGFGNRPGGGGPPGIRPGGGRPGDGRGGGPGGGRGPGAGAGGAAGGGGAGNSGSGNGNAGGGGDR